jgi:hypothetical protein
VQEIAEFRVDEEFAPTLFSESEGKRTSTGIRIIVIDTGDPRFRRICELQTRLLKKKGRPFFFGWRLTRKSTVEELRTAGLLHVTRLHAFEPAGEECGTKYDESSACPHCGVGAKQVGPLFLDVKRIPKGRDFAETIAGETIVSRRAADVFVQHGITGIAFHPVRARGARSLKLSPWSQMVIRSAEAEIAPPTRTRINPCEDDRDGGYICPDGHVIGLNLLSAVSIRAASRGKADFVTTRQLTGTRRGLLRPRRAILVSQKAWRLIKSERLKGFEFEVAHLV